MIQDRFKIYKLFNGVPFTGTIAGYNARDRMYHIVYEDGDEECLFHNEFNYHKDKIDPSEIKEKLKPATSTLTKLKPAAPIK